VGGRRPGCHTPVDGVLAIVSGVHPTNGWRARVRQDSDKNRRGRWVLGRDPPAKGNAPACTDWNRRRGGACAHDLCPLAADLLPSPVVRRRSPQIRRATCRPELFGEKGYAQVSVAGGGPDPEPHCVGRGGHVGGKDERHRRSPGPPGVEADDASGQHAQRPPPDADSPTRSGRGVRQPSGGFPASGPRSQRRAGRASGPRRIRCQVGEADPRRSSRLPNAGGWLGCRPFVGCSSPDGPPTQGGKGVNS
jgi:hypothetical protein